MILLVGLRGEPGKEDEPQHKKQGRITQTLFDTLEIPHKILPSEINEARNVIDLAIKYTKSASEPFALIVKKGTFEPYSLKNIPRTEYDIGREEAIKLIVSQLGSRDIVVSTTGMASRELYEHRLNQKQSHDGDFLTVGSMGHSSSIALGIAMQKPDRNVYCLDGDGAVIMHMGSLAIIGSQKPRNLRHIIINNECHDSVGGQ